MLDIYAVITLFWIIVGVGVAYIIYLCEAKYWADVRDNLNKGNNNG